MLETVTGMFKKAIIDYSLKSMKDQEWYDKPFFIVAKTKEEFFSKLKSRIKQHDFVPLPITLRGSDWDETTHSMTAYSIELQKIRTFTEERLNDNTWVVKPSALTRLEEEMKNAKMVKNTAVGLVISV